MESMICEYFNWCNIKKLGRDCADYKTCETHNFYKVTELGIGGTDFETIKRLERELLGGVL
jgi:hypothetical protein